MRKGLTLIELLITTVLVAILIAVMANIFRAILISWSAQEARSGVDIGMARGIDEMARDLREAKAVTSANDEIRFTTVSNTNHVYYFYNNTSGTYELRKAELSGSIAGALVDAGRIVTPNILPPTDFFMPSDLSIAGNMLTLDLSAELKGERIRLKTQVRPRNL